jgi:hypothetical protein
MTIRITASRVFVEGSSTIDSTPPKNNRNFFIAIAQQKCLPFSIVGCAPNFSIHYFFSISFTFFAIFNRVVRWNIFKPKIPIRENFWRVLQ